MYKILAYRRELGPCLSSVELRNSSISEGLSDWLFSPAALASPTGNKGPTAYVSRPVTANHSLMLAIPSGSRGSAVEKIAPSQASINLQNRCGVCVYSYIEITLTSASSCRRALQPLRDEPIV